MPSCQDCKMLMNNNCMAKSMAEQELKRPLPPPPSGACMIPIVESYLSLIKPGNRVLEIGCGSWSKIKDYCDTHGAHYEGIDPKSIYYDHTSVATRFENLADLSFEDESFDFVIGNQTMEHWAENGCSNVWGLYQCFRVLRPNGVLLMNVPFHFHGTKLFLLGKLNSLEKLFGKFSNDVKVESWGNPCTPLTPYYPHPEYARLQKHPSYVVDIRATKNKTLPKISRGMQLHGKLAQLMYYPLSYNFYRLKNKLGSQKEPTP